MLWCHLPHRFRDSLVLCPRWSVRETPLQCLTCHTRSLCGRRSFIYKLRERNRTKQIIRKTPFILLNPFFLFQLQLSHPQAERQSVCVDMLSYSLSLSLFTAVGSNTHILMIASFKAFSVSLQTDSGTSISHPNLITGIRKNITVWQWENQITLVYFGSSHSRSSEQIWVSRVAVH